MFLKRQKEFLTDLEAVKAFKKQEDERLNKDFTSYEFDKEQAFKMTLEYQEKIAKK